MTKKNKKRSFLNLEFTENKTEHINVPVNDSENAPTTEEVVETPEIVEETIVPEEIVEETIVEEVDETPEVVEEPKKRTVKDLNAEELKLYQRTGIIRQ